MYRTDRQKERKKREGEREGGAGRGGDVKPAIKSTIVCNTRS